MEDTQGGPKMGLLIKPLWDPTGDVSIEVDDERRELTVTGRGERLRFALSEDRPDQLGWHELRARAAGKRRRRVAVSLVVCHCLREWEAEQAVIALSERAAARATARGGKWTASGRRLADQARAARRCRRVSTLPFQVLFEHHSTLGRGQALTAALAAERVGYSTVDGRSDTQRLKRRFGLAGQRTGHAEGGRWQRSVRYETGVALCRAVELDPVELGL